MKLQRIKELIEANKTIDILKTKEKMLFLPQVAKFRKLRCVLCGSFLGWRDYTTTQKDVIYCRKCRNFVEVKEIK